MSSKDAKACKPGEKPKPGEKDCKAKPKSGGGGKKAPEPEQTCYEKCSGLPDWTRNLVYAIPLIIAAPFITRAIRCRKCPQVQTPKKKPPPPPPKDPCCPPCCCPPCKPDKEPSCKPPKKKCDL